MKDPRITKAVAALCEAFNRQPTPATFGAYEIGLAGMTPEQVERGAALALQRCKFMPAPAEIRELAIGGGQSPEAMAALAFDTLRDAVQGLGSDYSVNFSDGAINATVRMLGGWQRVCEMPAEEFDKWFRKDFVTCYVNVVRNGVSPEAMRYLGGNLERDNAHWDGQVNPRSGATYSLERFGCGVRTIGADYAPALPAPPILERKQLSASRNFLRLKDGRLTAAASDESAANN